VSQVEPPPRLLTPEGVKLRRLWDEHRSRPFPASGTEDPRLQEIALYASWLGSLVEGALANGGYLTASHRRMLAARRAENDRSVWRAAGDLGEPARSFVAGLLAMEDGLADLPDQR
jgi:hypothetical protein